VVDQSAEDRAGELTTPECLFGSARGGPAYPSSIQWKNLVSEELSITRPQTATGWWRNVLWGVKILVALAFLAAGGRKLAGVRQLSTSSMSSV
jgi:hypothetical protein